MNSGNLDFSQCSFACLFEVSKWHISAYFIEVACVDHLAAHMAFQVNLQQKKSWQKGGLHSYSRE